MIARSDQVAAAPSRRSLRSLLHGVWLCASLGRFKWHTSERGGRQIAGYAAGRLRPIQSGMRHIICLDIEC